MKCFERLVMHNIKTSLPNTLDPLQFAYRPNPSTDDAISSTLYLALTHLENKDSYVRMLFIDFSSAFNTTIPQQLINKWNLLGLNNSLCYCILSNRNTSVLVSWTWQWVHFTQMAYKVTRSQSNRAPLGCGGTGDSHHGCAANLQQLCDAIMSLWIKISEECFQHLTESIPRRIKAVLKVKGGPTRY